MASSYEQLLEGTIRHLERLRERGRKFVTVSPKVSRELSAPVETQVASGARPSEVSRTTPTAPGPRRSPTPTPTPLLLSPAPAPTAPELAGMESSLAPAKSGGSSALLSREEKEAGMAELRARASVCQKCPNLASSRKSVVFGVGDIHSPLMFVGEAPGADEDEQGEPFVGKAGQLLTRIIQTMGLGRNTVYIANILKCRPDTPGQSAGNRKPTPDEMKTCLPYLLAQVDLIQPKVIVALGATAVEGLLGKMPGITRLRGNWRTFRDIPLMPTYHPAYLLRNQSLSEKRKVWEDMLQVLERLDRPITDRQRGFFLKA